MAESRSALSDGLRVPRRLPPVPAAHQLPNSDLIHTGSAVGDFAGRVANQLITQCAEDGTWPILRASSADQPGDSYIGPICTQLAVPLIHPLSG